MLPCSDQDGLTPEVKQVSVRCLDSRYFNKIRFISNTLADIHFFSWHRFYQNNCSFISTTSQTSPLSRDGSSRICFLAGTLTLFLQILPWQSFLLQPETSYKANNIFSSPEERPLQGRGFSCDGCCVCCTSWLHKQSVFLFWFLKLSWGLLPWPQVVFWSCFLFQSLQVCSERSKPN